MRANGFKMTSDGFRCTYIVRTSLIVSIFIRTYCELGVSNEFSAFSVGMKNGSLKSLAVRRLAVWQLLPSDKLRDNFSP